MNRPIRMALLASLVLGAAALAGAAEVPPPLLDRELFFGNPEIAGAQISPDGQYVAFLKPWKDTRNIYVKKTGEPFDKARLVTTETKRPIPGFFWSRDSKLILYVKDKDGDENFNVWAVDPVGAERRGQRGARLAQPHRRQGRARVHLRGPEEVRPTRSTSASTTATRPGTTSTRSRSRPASASSCARTPSGSPAGTSTSTASCASRRASRTTATPRS